MTAWAVVILAIALLAATVNLIKGVQAGDTKMLLQDIIMFLLALGVLVRIRFKTKEGEKEKLKKEKQRIVGDNKKDVSASRKVARKKSSSKKKTAKQKAPAKKKITTKNKAR